MLDQSTHRILEILNGMYSYKEKLVYDKALENDDLKKKKIDIKSKDVNLEFTKKMMDNLDKLEKVDNKKEYIRILIELNLGLCEAAREAIYPLINRVEDRVRLEEEKLDIENGKLIDKNSKQMTFVSFGNKKVEMGIDESIYDRGKFNLRNCFYTRKLEKNDVIRATAKSKANTIRASHPDLIGNIKNEMSSSFVDQDIKKYQDYIISKRLELDKFIDSRDMSDKKTKKEYELLKDKITKQLNLVSKIIEKINAIRSNSMSIKQLETFLSAISSLNNVEESKMFRAQLKAKVEKMKKDLEKDQKDKDILVKSMNVNVQDTVLANQEQQQNKFITVLKANAISYDCKIDEEYNAKNNNSSIKKIEEYAK